MTYPGGDKVTYTYDTMDRLVTVTEPDGSITSYHYDALGRRIQTGTDNLTTNYTFDEAGNLTAQNTTGDTALSFAYKYNQNGQIVEETRKENNTSVVSQYTYDPLGQLTVFTNTQGYGENYTYDKVGNMTKKAILQGEETTTLTMAYNKGNQLTAMKNGRESVKYTYDKNGNLTQKQLGKQTDTYTYNAFDQLTGYMGYDGFAQNYTVDSYGLKVSQTQTGNTNRLTLEEMLQGKTLADVENNTDGQNAQSNKTVTTDFVYDYTLPYGQLIQERVTNGSTSSTTQYTYGLERISAINSGNTANAGTKTQYIYDGRTSVAQTITSQIGSKVTGLSAQGGTSTNTGNNANVNTNTGLPNTNPKAALTGANSTPQITSFTYTPFGEQLGKVGREKITGFGFNGEYYDSATGMLNLRARQYEPTMNRFSQKDLLRGSITHPLSQNRYGFVWNDPVNLIDINGLYPMSMSADGGGGSNTNYKTYMQSSMYGQYLQAVTKELDILVKDVAKTGTKKSVNNLVTRYNQVQGSLLTSTQNKYSTIINDSKTRLSQNKNAAANKVIVSTTKEDKLWVACATIAMNSFWNNNKDKFYTDQEFRGDDYVYWWQNPSINHQAIQMLQYEAQINGGYLDLRSIIDGMGPFDNIDPKTAFLFMLFGGDAKVLTRKEMDYAFDENNYNSLYNTRETLWKKLGFISEDSFLLDDEKRIFVITTEQIQKVGEYIEKGGFGTLFTLQNTGTSPIDQKKNMDEAIWMLGPLTISQGQSNAERKKITGSNNQEIVVDDFRVNVSDQPMYQEGSHFNKHGREMGYTSKKEYSQGAREFAKNAQKAPDVKVFKGTYNGSGKLGGTDQYIIQKDGLSAIIDVETGQVIDFYIGIENRGLVHIERIR